ncbi:hypothetical protein [Lactiplantibacillus pingfangensis]|uniref:hypothetical protein n=1 Tax=Lactiplantibacillus TaxID=2767842 RepID=UPI001CC3F8F3|nr:hypothetical protein [Lactiplantibacillus pingfangensis]
MAINTINLAGGPQEFAEFKIGDVTKKLYYNDDLNLKIANTQLSVSKRLKALGDQKEMAALDDKTVDQQRDYLVKLYADLRKELTEFFDEQFGKGTGDKLYLLTNKSTERMAAAFNMVAREYDTLRERRDHNIELMYSNRKARRKK